jgi:1-acyl-sn-glycerol-3-phosphate acyltransferase
MPHPPRPSPPESQPINRILQATNICFSRIYHRLTVHAPHRLPRSGPAILVCNHISGLDPLLIQSVCPRLVRWMMAKEYYDIRGLGWFFRQIQAIAVERSGRDIASVRAALRALSSGHIVGMFPEGKIETSRELLPFQTGVAMLAIKTGVPVFPAYLDGSQRNKKMLEAILQPAAAYITFGEVVNFDRSSTSPAVLEAATRKIANAVQDLRDKCSGTSVR